MPGDTGHILYENDFFYITYFQKHKEFYYFIKNDRHTIEEISKKFADYLIKVHKENDELKKEIARMKKQLTLGGFIK